jgi:hypothetical protein
MNTAIHILDATSAKPTATASDAVMTELPIIFGAIPTTAEAVRQVRNARLPMRRAFVASFGFYGIN